MSEKMKLSDAIRLGAMMRPSSDSWWGSHGSCVVGAAWEGACRRPGEDWPGSDKAIRQIYAQIEFPRRKSIFGTSFKGKEKLLWDCIILHMRCHSRTEVADWLDQRSFLTKMAERVRNVFLPRKHREKTNQGGGPTGHPHTEAPRELCEVGSPMSKV